MIRNAIKQGKLTLETKITYSENAAAQPPSKIGMPVGAELMVDVALRALFFYWFLTVTRVLLQANWVFAILLLIVNWVPSLFLSLIVDRFLGVTPLPG